MILSRQFNIMGHFGKSGHLVSWLEVSRLKFFLRMTVINQFCRILTMVY